jgi:pyridoxamine 5'-phosphate oxidase
LTKNEILASINTNLNAHVATMEGDKPHVRGMGIYRVDENGIVIQTWKKKDIHQQLVKNPQVEICFNSKDGKQIRVSGRVELAEDAALKKEIEAKRTFMTPIINQFGGYDAVAIWVMKHGKATAWTMAENFAPKTYVEL